jgi:hypothetical protein
VNNYGKYLQNPFKDKEEMDQKDIYPQKDNVDLE